jgi:hypothetical protein
MCPIQIFDRHGIKVTGRSQFIRIASARLLAMP